MLSTFPSPSFCINLRLHHKVIRAVQWLLKMVQLRRTTNCSPPIRSQVLRLTATWLTIQPHTAIEIASQEIIVAKKGYFSFREAGLIP